MKIILANQPADYEVKFIKNKDLSAFAEYKDFFELNNYEGSGILNHPCKRICFASLPQKPNYASISALVGKVIRELKGLKISSIKFDYEPLSCEFYSVYAHIYGALAGLYEFDKYKKEKSKVFIDTIILNAPNTKDALEGVELAKVLNEACVACKQIVNEIPSVYTQEQFAIDAKKLAEELDLECNIYQDDYLKEQGMNAFLAVNRASAHPATLVHLAYKPKNAKKRVVFVGKGLVYDTGGLSLKPADYMLTMKSDKAGAAAAMNIIKAAAMLKLPLEIHSVLGCAQNCISENSYMPDDVLISREGVSIEVRNTDAEGRLVLADSLSFAQDLQPDLLIDLATLTGACVVGVGEFTSAIMGFNEDLAAEFYEHSLSSAELTCVLHFNEHLKELIKSKIADVSNSASSRYGGSITAGMFLGEFIRDEFKDKWLHLDIAGPAYLEKAWGENAAGAGASGVRMCIVHLLKMLRKDA